MNSNYASDVLKIIEKLVKSGRKTLDENLIKQLKKACKNSDEYVRQAYHALMTQLAKDHSEIRFSALLIINELFCRSSCFRKLLEIDLEEFLELVVETDPENPLPLPQASAKDLKLKGLELMQAWALKFGDKYIRFQMGLTYLKKCKKVDFNDMEARSVVQREQHRQEQERIERILNEKIVRVRSEMEETCDEISGTLLQMENCFRLLIPHPDEFFSTEDFATSQGNTSLSADNTDGVLDMENSLRHHGLHNMKKPITIEIVDSAKVAVCVNEDTQPVIDNLMDLHKQMITRFFPLVANWLKILTKGSNCTDILKKAIDIKQSIESAFQKYRDLKINSNVPNFGSEDEDDDFEEVTEKEGYEDKPSIGPVSFRNSSQPSCSKNMTDVEKASMWKLRHSKDDVTDPTSAASTIQRMWDKHGNSTSCLEDVGCNSSTAKSGEDKESLKTKLLDKAPIRPYDIDLYHWEDENPIIPERIKFDSLHKFWESKNDDNDNETLKEAQIASLRTRKIDFSGKFVPIKWTCRFPLANGKLCPRKDRYKCPFHGKIVERDVVGNPVNPSEVPGTSSQGSSTVSSAVAEWQDPELLRDIEAATGIDLKIPQKGKRKSKDQGGLTNVKKIQNTVRDRLSKKIDKRYKHYAKKMDDMERKRFNDKFGDQWNYY